VKGSIVDIFVILETVVHMHIFMLQSDSCTYVYFVFCIY